MEALKKKSAKKSGAKKEEKTEPAVEASTNETPASIKEEASSEPVVDQAAVEEIKTTEPEEAQEQGEEIADLQNVVRPRQPSISVQSKMRSSSFRASSGPLSPAGFPFSPEGDTAPEIYRKQAIRIEELEKENKRLAKEASDGEKRWKKAEEELEDLREADDEPKEAKNAAAVSSAEVEKLVRYRVLSIVAYIDQKIDLRESHPATTSHAAPSTNSTLNTSRLVPINLCITTKQRYPC